MNWFQNFVSLWSETVRLWDIVFWLKLWIGFKILYLCDLKQLLTCSRIAGISCELVSKFCIFVIWNSTRSWRLSERIVVNWFQNFVSLWSETVIKNDKKAQKSCELVSKFCIFVIWNSLLITISNSWIVVNWFQNFVSLWSETVKKTMN